MADYLESYAAQFALLMRSRARVTSLERAGAGFRVRTDASLVEARTVVIATGAYQTPAIPTVASCFSADVHQLTPNSYKNPSSVPAGTVLVVGDGATGRQIARELTKTHSVLLAAGRPRSASPDRILGRGVCYLLDMLAQFLVPAFGQKVSAEV